MHLALRDVISHSNPRNSDRLLLCPKADPPDSESREPSRVRRGANKERQSWVCRFTNGVVSARHEVGSLDSASERRVAITRTDRPLSVIQIATYLLEGMMMSCLVAGLVTRVY
jgi:hypothetical protein